MSAYKSCFLDLYTQEPEPLDSETLVCPTKIILKEFHDKDIFYRNIL